MSLVNPDTLPAAGGKTPPDAEERRALCRRLITNLDLQNELYGRHLEAAKRHRRALIKNDLSENQAATEAADALCAELARLEQERILLADRLAGRTAAQRPGRVERPPAKCAELYPLLDTESAEELRRARDRLVERTACLKRELDINKSLTENARRIIHTTLAILTSVVGRPGDDRLAVYGSQGRLRTGRTQVRSLFSRTV